MFTAFGIAAAVAGVAGAALRGIPDTNSAIHGCYVAGQANAVGGAPLTIVNPSKTSCGAGKVSVSWQAGPPVVYGAVQDNGTTASFYMGGRGMHVTHLSTGVTKLTFLGGVVKPVVTVTAVGGVGDSTQHCVVGDAISSASYKINCFDQGVPWNNLYHVIAIP